MPADHKLEISIEYAQLQKFCQQLITRSRDIAKTHDALITLETFFSNFSRDKQGSESYKAIESLLKAFTDETREQLLQQRTGELLKALRAQNVHAVASIHTPLSRNGFYLILQAATARMEQQETLLVNQWASKWTLQAKQKADQFSQYPDAPDFKAAGIKLAEYLAMVDVKQYLDSVLHS